MAKNVYLSDSNIGLGAFSLPVLNFVERDEQLKARNPQLNELERAAVVYFGMLAETPEPTRGGDAIYIDSNFNSDKNFWAEQERRARYDVAGTGYIKFIKDSVTTAYYQNLKRLQEWLSANGLTEGIQKTLNEQSRRLQGLRAGIEASKAAAARALGLSQITEEMSEEARAEAAEAQAKAQKQYNEALDRENELNRQLDNISKGLPADYKSGDLAAGGVPVLPLVAGGLFIFWLGTRKGKKAVR